MQSTSVIKQLEIMTEHKNSRNDLVPHTVNIGDTLVVGYTPRDTLFVSGKWSHTGPIFVFNDGVIIFKNADATILGDLFVVGSGKVFADSSALYFPQQYFYQRTILVFQNGSLNLTNTTLNYGGFSHNLSVGDSGSVLMNNITQTDFTTAGVSGKGTIAINRCNLAGEFIVMDSAYLRLQKVKTAIIWHYFPSNSTINHAFPSGDNLISYSFNNSTKGVKGISYKIQVDSSSDIQWGLMPVNGSDITISQSLVRAIGLWFKGKDSSSVDGLVNNSSYSDFSAQLTDRSLRLINSSVKTWSLYVFDAKNLFVSGSVLGEVGSFGSSKVLGANYWVDGSGGYCFASDTSVYYNSNSVVSSSLRSERNAMMIFAYSTQTGGITASTGRSVLIIVQSSIAQDPVAYDQSSAWLANIAQPSTCNTDAIVPIIGSAWIDKTDASLLMDFSYFSMDYQKEGDNGWTALMEKTTKESRNDTLAKWNTQSLTAGKYTLRLTLADTWGNTVEAKKPVVMLPSIVNVAEFVEDLGLTVFPNPFSSQFFLKTDINLNNATLTVKNIFGQTLVQRMHISGQNITFDRENLPSGIYFITITQNDKIIAIKKVVIAD